MKAARTGVVIPYRLGARLMDWYQGWRDGRAGIPDPETSAGRVTTPHRDALIRLALEIFNHERLRYERARGDAPDRVAAVTARLDQLHAHEADARQHLAEVSVPLSEEERTRRRIGDLDRAELVIVQRRRDDQRRHIAAARMTLDSIMAEIGYAEAEKAAAAEADQRELSAASIRVYWYHEYIHRRLNSYLRTLIRHHFDGEWARVHLTIDPFLPGWISLDAIPKLPTVTFRLPPPTATEESKVYDDPPVVIPLRPDSETVFGSEQPAPYNLDAVEAGPRHFALSPAGQGRLRLRDFGHGNGPYRNGIEVKSDLLTAGDAFDFANHRYRVLDGCTALERTRTRTSDPGEMLAVAGLCALARKKSPGHESKRLLTDMTFVQGKGTVLAVVGRSGAGKSSLLKVLIGDVAATEGRAFFDDLDMLGRPAQLSEQMGFVPQDIDMYEALTVQQLLGYSFQLRYPGPANRAAPRISDVCDQLQLEKQLDQLVATLSGGQKRRVSIAMELLSKPDLLILDEPTSGLDPGMDREIMKQLRAYADDGKTVIVTTHNMNHLMGPVDKVLVVGDGGRPIYFGDPEVARRDLGVETYADLMDCLTGPGEQQSSLWSVERAAAYQLTAGAQAARDSAARQAVKSASSRPPRAQRERRGAAPKYWRELSTLVRRQVTLLRVRGRTTTGLSTRTVVTALLPYVSVAIGAALAATISPPSGLGSHGGRAVATAIGVLTTLAMLGGQALTYGDLVAEFPIVQREHRTGVALSAIILSKWLVFSAAAVIQATFIVVAFRVIKPGPTYSNLLSPPIVELWADLAVLTIGSMSLGLLISAACRKLEQAVAVVTLTSIAQIALNGTTAPVPHWLLWSFAVVLPDRWGASAAASSVNLDKFPPFAGPPDPLWAHMLSRWGTDLAVTGLLAAVYTLLATYLLWRRLRPARPPRRATARSGGR